MEAPFARKVQGAGFYKVHLLQERCRVQAAEGKEDMT